MKQKILLPLLLILSVAAKSQAVTDSVLIGTGYTKQVWYSLKNDEKATTLKNSWDLAFEMGGIATTISLNTAAGNEVWTYPKGDTAAWATIDTVGIAGWKKLYNSDTTWSMGAFNMGYTADPFDLGWGMYDVSTHIITGDSLFVVKLANGTYKKLWLQNLANGSYNFRFANLNGSGDKVTKITKADFAGKNFGYYSLQTETSLNPEPASAEWDLLFTQYTTFLLMPQPTPYPVTGVLANKGVTVAKAHPIANVQTYETHSNHNFATAINTIGYNWKRYDMNAAAYVIEDSTIYFVKDKAGDIWKMIFTGFASTNGKMAFTKENLTGSNSINRVNKINAFFSVYPNPAQSNDIYAVLDAPNSQHAQISITDLSGKTVSVSNLDVQSGLNTYSLPSMNLQNGMYIISMQLENGVVNQRLLIQK